jgi:bisphosphoglycerate-dependent phosphoglycerate mutase
MFNYTDKFLRLQERHTGQYIGEKVAECLERYGIEKLACTFVFFSQLLF